MEPKARVFVGRSHELGEIDVAVAQAQRGEGAFLLLAGEAGIGKTRLADEAVRRSGFRALWGRCWEAGGAPAYWPWIQALRALLRGPPRVTVAPKAREGLARILPELRAAEETGDVAVDLEAARFALFEAVTDVLRDAAEEAPLALVIDDLHVADPSSLSLLSFFIRDLRGARVLLVATCRDHEARSSSERADLFAKIAREGTYLQLRRFGVDEVRELLVRRFGGDERAAEIFRLTEGHPLFVEEMIRTLASGRVGDASALPVPHGVRDAIRTRLSLLDSEARAVLEAAAACGRDVTIATLATVCALDARQIEVHVRAAIGAGVLVEIGASRFEFSHALVRDAIYDAVDGGRRAELHATVADALEREGAVDTGSAEIATHLLAAVAAVGPERAWDGALRASRRALAALAFEDAATIMERTVSALGARVDKRRRAEGLLVLGEARIRSGRRDDGRRACETVAELARAAGDPELLARAALAYGAEIVVALIDQTLIRLLEEALRTLPQTPSALRVQVLARLAGALQPAPDPSGPIALAKKAIAEARALGDPHVLRIVLGSAGSALVEYADPLERLEVDAEMLHLAAAAGDKDVAIRAQGRIVLDRLELGDVRLAEDAIAAYAKLAEEIGRPKLAWRAMLYRCALATLAGDFREASRLAADTRAITKASADREQRLFQSQVRCALAFAQFADPADLVEAVDEACAAFRGFPGGESLETALRSQALARAGRLEEARAQIAGFDDDAPIGVGEPNGIFYLSECVALVGDRDRARIYLDRIARYADRFATWGAYSPAVDAAFETIEGMLASCAGDRPRAERCFASSIARATRCGARAALARAYVEAGLGLSDAAQLEKGIAIAEELGMALLVARARGKPVARPSRAPAAAFSLERDGELWKVVSASGTFRLKDTKGLQMLAHLLARPHEEIHVLALGTSGDPGDLGDAGDVLDAGATKAYRTRLVDLREQEREAEANNDSGRLQKVREEIAFLAGELAGGLGLGGRRRKAAAVAERARVNVQRRVKDAIKRVEEQDPVLGRYLGWTVRTGIFCAYEPPR